MAKAKESAADESPLLISTGIIGLTDGEVLQSGEKKTSEEWGALGINVEKFIEFGTLRPFVAADLTDGEAESIVQTHQRLTSENEALKAENEALKAQVAELTKAPA